MRSAWSHAASAWAVSLRKLLSEAAESRTQLVGQRPFGRRRAVGADEHDLKLGDARSGLIVDIKTQGDRGRSECFYGRGHAQFFIQARRRVEIRREVYTRQPTVKCVEDFAVGRASGAEQLRFGNLDKADESSVADDACRVDIAPTDVLFDSKRRADSIFPPQLF